ncbi:hypothetical protein ACFSNO_33770, partial [Streptomyces cirratus]
APSRAGPHGQRVRLGHLQEDLVGHRQCLRRYQCIPHDPVRLGDGQDVRAVDHSDSDKQKAALRDFGKSLVAWDEWDKNPSRAFGTVVFNGVTLGSGTLLKLGKAGKLGVAAEVATTVGKAGALVDPMSYLGKAAVVTKLKVGDLMEGLRASRAGVDDMARNVPSGASPHPGEAPRFPATNTSTPRQQAGHRRRRVHPGRERQRRSRHRTRQGAAQRRPARHPRARDRAGQGRAEGPRRRGRPQPCRERHGPPDGWRRQG